MMNSVLKMVDCVSKMMHYALKTMNSRQVSLKWDTQTDECWATDAAFVNDKLYFYVSAGGGQVAVMAADSSKGPWSDPLGKPLMSPAFGKAQVCIQMMNLNSKNDENSSFKMMICQDPPTTFRDPCVFLDPGTGDYYSFVIFNTKFTSFLIQNSHHF